MKIKTFLRVFLTVFGSIGILMSLGVVISAWKQVDFMRTASRVEGTVIENYALRSRSHGRNSYKAIVEYRDVHGKTKWIASGFSTSSPDHEIGDKVVVLVSPDGKQSAIDSFGENWFVSIMCGIFALAFGTPALVVFELNRRKAKLAQYLKDRGEFVETSDFKIAIDYSTMYNDKNPYYLKCRAKVDGESLTFKSGHIWENPEDKVADRKIRIYYMRGAPKKYWVDLEFLEPAIPNVTPV